MTRKRDSMCLVSRYTVTKVYHWGGYRDENGVVVSACGKRTHEVGQYAADSYWIDTNYVSKSLRLCKVCERLGPWPTYPNMEREARDG